MRRLIFFIFVLCIQIILRNYISYVVLMGYKTINKFDNGCILHRSLGIYKHILIHLVLALRGIQMERKVKFTNERIKALPANPPDAKGTDLEFSDTEVTGLKCLSGSTGNKPWLLHYSTSYGRKSSIAIGRFPDIDVARMRCCVA